MFYVKKADYDSSNTKNKNDEFFSDQNEVTSVVREAIQNVIDASQKNTQITAKARFSFKDIAWDKFSKFIDTDDGITMNEHWNSSSFGRHAKDHSNQTVRTLIIEDYNTTGLTGSFDKDEENSQSNLVNFWWMSGIGTKGKGTLGNAGVGKIVFTAASEMRTMWAVSNRLNEKFDPTVLIGYTDLPYHHVNGQSYLGYARYGLEEDLPSGKKALNPIVEQQQINEFIDVFSLTRNEPGLSLIIPAVSQEFTQSAIVEAILEHYFLAIINKKLVVEVVADDGVVEVLEPSTLASALQKHQPNNVGLNKRVEYALHSYQLLHSRSPKAFIGLEPELDLDQKRYVFTKDQLTTDNLDLMREYFDAGEMLMLEFAVPFTDLRDQKSKSGKLNIFFQKLGSKEVAPKEFMRLSISLTKMANSLSRMLPKNVFCFVMIEDEDMSDFVLSAEDVAHTGVTKRQFNKNKLFTPIEVLSFISNVSDDVYKILNRSDEDSPVIESFDEHIFSIQLPDPSGQTQKKTRNKKTKPPKIVVQDRKTPVFGQRELKDETSLEVYSLDAFKDALDQRTLQLPIKLKIKCAYLTLNGANEAWKLYSKHDFEIGKDIKISFDSNSSVEVIKKELNTLSVAINSTDFCIRLSGFDENRDLTTSIRLED